MNRPQQPQSGRQRAIVSRDAQRTDRWVVRFAGANLGWCAGPIGVGVYADLRTRRRWMFFSTWQLAYDYAYARVYRR